MSGAVAPARLSSHATIAPPAPSGAITGSCWFPDAVHRGTPPDAHIGVPALFTR